MAHTIESIASLIGARIVTLDGCVATPQEPVTGAAAIEQAKSGELTFLSEDRHISRLKETSASAVVIHPSQSARVNADYPRLVLLEVEDPQAAFLQVLPLFRIIRSRLKRGISPSAFISSTARIGENCAIGPGAYIGEDVIIGDDCDIHPGASIGAGSRLGRDCQIYSNAVLYHEVLLGDRVIIHANAVLGADGFGYRFEQGRFIKVPQLGGVIIESDVEIGAGATIDRGAVDATVIGAGTKIDNMVMIGHNCRVGRNNVFAAQVGLAGSCSTGDYVRLGGQVGVKDHTHMGTGCMVGAKAGVHRNVPDGETWIGYPASPEAEQKRLVFTLKRVPEMREEMRAMAKRLAELEKLMAEGASNPLKAAG